MTQLERLYKLNSYLLKEAPQYKEQAAKFGSGEEAQFRLFRSLVNVRPPKKASKAFLGLQGEYLKEEINRKLVTKLCDLTPIRENIYIWNGDITSLAADAVVNAANSQMLGCFCPCHGCIDNAVHTYAGVELRLACAELMRKQGHEEATGQAKITPAFNLPSNYVIHTVGPIINESVTEEDCKQLSSCYRSCLALADKHSLKSIAFCCISTGEFRFPKEKAAEIAIETVCGYKKKTGSKIEVIFNVWEQTDYEIYRRLFG